MAHGGAIGGQMTEITTNAEPDSDMQIGKTFSNPLRYRFFTAQTLDYWKARAPSEAEFYAEVQKQANTIRANYFGSRLLTFWILVFVVFLTQSLVCDALISLGLAESGSAYARGHANFVTGFANLIPGLRSAPSWLPPSLFATILLIMALMARRGLRRNYYRNRDQQLEAIRNRTSTHARGIKLDGVSAFSAVVGTADAGEHDVGMFAAQKFAEGWDAGVQLDAVHIGVAALFHRLQNWIELIGYGFVIANILAVLMLAGLTALLYIVDLSGWAILALVYATLLYIWSILTVSHGNYGPPEGPHDGAGASSRELRDEGAKSVGALAENYDRLVTGRGGR